MQTNNDIRVLTYVQTDKIYTTFLDEAVSDDPEVQIKINELKAQLSELDILMSQPYDWKLGYAQKHLTLFYELLTLYKGARCA